MDIRCGHCCGRHQDVASVRTCGQRVQPLEVVQDGWPVVARPEPVTVGMYRKDGEIYKVDWTPRGHLFAKVATVSQDETGRTLVSYTGAKGMVARLTQADRMSLDEVAEFGRLTATCMRCGIVLENPESVAAGIGPICAGKV